VYHTFLTALIHRQNSVYIQCLFFFQAEDGIRDRNVTGVQTLLFRSASCVGARVPFPTRVVAAPPQLLRSARPRRLGGRDHCPDRSEERRVGKECRDGWGRVRERRGVSEMRVWRLGR